MNAKELADALKGMIEELKRSIRPTRGFHGPTAQKNPNKKRGRGYTKAPYNFKKVKAARKQAKESKRINRSR